MNTRLNKVVKLMELTDSTRKVCEDVLDKYDEDISMAVYTLRNKQSPTAYKSLQPKEDQKRNKKSPTVNKPSQLKERNNPNKKSPTVHKPSLSKEDSQPDKKSYHWTLLNGKTLGSVKTEIKLNKNARAILVDETKEITQILIRLSNGSRAVIRANPLHTVGNIYDHVKHMNPTLKPSFVLISGYPSRNLTDFKMTIGEAKLENSVIIQKP